MPASGRGIQRAVRKVTVVVASRNRREQLLDTLPRHQAPVILVDDASTDGTAAAVAARLPRVRTPTQPGPSVLGFLACAAVVRRDVFLAVGGFQPKLHVYGEEALLAMDLAAQGWGLAYLPSLVVRHLPVPNGRDQAARRRLTIRNDLLTTWLRRPATRAVREAARALATPDGRGGLHDALAELPWVLRHRRRVPPHLEAALRRLEIGQATVG